MLPARGGGRAVPLPPVPAPRPVVDGRRVEGRRDRLLPAPARRLHQPRGGGRAAGRLHRRPRVADARRHRVRARALRGQRRAPDEGLRQALRRLAPGADVHRADAAGSVESVRRGARAAERHENAGLRRLIGTRPRSSARRRDGRGLHRPLGRHADRGENGRKSRRAPAHDTARPREGRAAPAPRDPGVEPRRRARGRARGRRGGRLDRSLGGVF
mmetsp:Transcript_36117/g.111757  ORF Transcript_36117/g.111757 Transcript_36117/m.111757 type:complete len:215 (-) Transcript_36117:25-669(-)